VTERWYAPDLRVVVATKRIDPRIAATSYAPVNIVRGEPPPHLFELPADSRFRDQYHCRERVQKDRARL